MLQRRRSARLTRLARLMTLPHHRLPAALCRMLTLALTGAGLLVTAASSAQSLPPLPSPPRPSIAGSSAPATEVRQPALPPMPLMAGTEVDRLVAIVNNDLILDSDVDQERRVAALLPYGESGGTYTRDAAIQRLINRDLILQQTKLQPTQAISEADAAKDLDSLR